MKLLATYTNEDPPEIKLSDIETAEILHTIEPSTDRRTSLYWRAVYWAALNGHKIVDTDRSALTNGECDPHQDDLSLNA